MFEEKLSRLRRVISSGDTAIAIDAALASVAESRDPRTIVPLLLMLNDDTDDNGMWSVVHAVEQFEDSIYIENFIRALPDLMVASSRWVSILMMRVLNSDFSRAELVRQLRSAPDDARRSAKTLCQRINERDVSFLAKTTSVLIAAGN